jgi:hypothetical protein
VPPVVVARHKLTAELLVSQLVGNHPAVTVAEQTVTFKAHRPGRARGRR